jgi:ribosomal protein S18 acetylase RimI-like enzyme
LHYPGHDPAQDRWVAVAAHDEGQLLGFGSISKAPQNSFADMFLVVRPAWREKGIGGELLKRLMERVQVIQPQSILTYVDVKNQRAIEFARKRGFAPLAAYTAMRLEADKSLPQPIWPAGYIVRPYNPEADFPLLLEMYNRAFQGLWGHWETVTEESVRDIVENPAGSFLLFDSAGEVVGICRGELSEQLQEKYGKPTGYLDAPGVVPEQRENGLYLPQMLHVAHWVCSQASHEAIAIELESWGDSPQTLAAYQSMGFEIIRQQSICCWQRELR